MGQFILRRLMHGIIVILGVSILVFIAVELAPGDVVDAMMPPESQTTEEAKARVREQLGLNDPAPLRYVQWLSRVVQADLGFSLVARQPVVEMILTRLPSTLQLVGFAMVVSIIVGVGTGILAAVKQYSWVDYLTTFFSFFWLSVPGFFLGLGMIYIFAVTLNWFPGFGATTAGSSYPILDRLHHLVLPGITLALELAATLTRYTRASVLEVLNLDYMRTARAKGLHNRQVLTQHALRNALIPIVTVVAVRLPFLIGGAVIIESVFQWPGLGTLMLNASTQKDYPVVMGLALIITALVVASSFLADLAYGFIDPRIRVR